MASLKKQEQATTNIRTKYDLDNPDDRKKVRDFEAEISQYLNQKKEVTPYKNREGTIFKKELTGFDLYMHEKRLFYYSEEYPLGVVSRARFYEYRDAMMKMEALRKLWDRRDKAEKCEAEKVEQIAVMA